MASKPEGQYSQPAYNRIAQMGCQDEAKEQPRTHD